MAINFRDVTLNVSGVGDATMTLARAIEANAKAAQTLAAALGTIGPVTGVTILQSKSDASESSVDMGDQDMSWSRDE